MYTDDDDANRPPEDDAGLTAAERELARALRGLRPAAPRGIDRDAMLFEAGRAAASRSLFRWRMTAAAAGVLAAAAGVMFAGRLGEPKVVREVVYVDRPASAPASQPRRVQPDVVTVASSTPIARPLLLAGSGEPSGLLLRDRALRWGVSAALSASADRASSPRPSRPSTIDVNQLLGQPTDASPDLQPSGKSLKSQLLHREQL
jgi:hypothetical protein